MVASNAKSTLGGRNAQKGLLYQNSIAATHLFELLIGADRVFRVTTETPSSVDDILVERRNSGSSYYQVKCYERVSEWTVNRLQTSGILKQFQAQQANSKVGDRLILSSPVPFSNIHSCAEEVRKWNSFQPSHRNSLPEHLRQIWSELANVFGSESQTYSVLHSYHEEPWPADPDRIREICLGRYLGSPYATIEGLWYHLRDIAGREAVRGRPLKRTDLLDLLDDRLSISEAAKLVHTDISLARQAAKPAWYVSRDEEFDLLSAIHDLLHHAPRNVVIMGDGGTGKSSFFSWMQREFAKDSRLNVVPLTAEGGDPLELIDAINRALRSTLHGMEPEGSSGQSRIERFTWYVDRASDAVKFVVIIIDHFEALFASIFVNQSRDKLAQARYSIFDAIARTRERKNLMWVFLARSEYFFLMFPNEDSLRSLNMYWVQLQDFSDEQSTHLLRKLAKIAGVDLSSDAERLLLLNSPKNPQKLVLAFLNICRAMPSHITGGDVLRLQPWEDIFRQDFSSLDEDETQVVYAVASLMVSTARRAFTFEEIEGSLSKMPVSQLRDVLHRIQATKGLLQQPAPGHYGLYHENFASYVIARHGGQIRTAESVRQYGDFISLLLHQTKGSLHAIMADVSLLTQIDYKEPRGEDRLRKLVDRIAGSLASYIDMFRSTELVVREDPAMAEGLVAKERVSLTQVIRRVMQYRKNMAVRSEIRVELPRGEMIMQGDYAMLSTALGHVIDNAVRYSARGEDVLLRARSENGVHVVRISNIGIGIPLEERTKVFDMFYRGSEAVSRFPAGTGLGLYSAKRIVEALHGTIEIESRPSGSRGYHYVTVTLKFPKI